MWKIPVSCIKPESTWNWDFCVWIQSFLKMFCTFEEEWKGNQSWGKERGRGGDTIERGGANFLPSLSEESITSFVMLPCLQKAQLQIISQLWETPPGVNNSLSTPQHGLAPEGEAVEEAIPARVRVVAWFAWLWQLFAGFPCQSHHHHGQAHSWWPKGPDLGGAVS